MFNIVVLTYWAQFGIFIGIKDENETMKPLEMHLLPMPSTRIGLTQLPSFSKVLPTYIINSCPKTLLLEWLQPYPLCWNWVSCLIFASKKAMICFNAVYLTLPCLLAFKILFCWLWSQFADIKCSFVFEQVHNTFKCLKVTSTLNILNLLTF